ncbi:MAG: tetratricopeptide repeat protein [Candidatus Methanofastidiosia archaeon]|jgi:tetratricopeptide (TPR) repeat protein
MNPQNSNEKEAELMFEILNFARTHERKIYEGDLNKYNTGKAHQCVEKLVNAEYLQKVEKEEPHFYGLVAKGLNLFEDKRLEEPVPEELKNRILETIEEILGQFEIKPWELMFHVIHVIGIRKSMTAEGLLDYLENQFPDTRGVSKPSVYRNLKRLRMKEYIEYEKVVYKGSNSYILSEKGKEIFSMTQDDAISRLRTAEEWDKALRHIIQRKDEEKRQEDSALFDMFNTSVPDLDDSQVIWVLYSKANVYELKGHLDEAESTYLQMEQICEEVTDEKGRAYAVKGLGNAAFKQERFKAAEQYYRKCKKIAETLKDSMLLSDVLNNLGSCAYITDDIDKALELYKKALELAGDDASRQASTLYNQGLCYGRKEHLDKARELWSKSLALYKKAGEEIEIKRVEHNLREIDRKQKKEHLEAKYRDAKEFGTAEDIEKAYKELAKFKLTNLKDRGVYP